MNLFAQEFRYAIRRLLKAPLFALTATLTLAIGMAANSAFFSTFDALILRPLAIPDLSHVVVLSERMNGHDMRAAFADFDDWVHESTVFSEFAAHHNFDVTLTGTINPELIRASETTASLFPLLRAEPFLGRIFRLEENRPGSELEVILSYSFWRTHFGSDRNVLGRTIRLNSLTYTVIGVMPEGFRYSPSTAVWLPLNITPQVRANRTDRSFVVIGRLRQDVTLQQAQAEMNGVAAALAKRNPITNRALQVHVQRIVDYLNNGQTPIFFGMIIGVTICLMLVVCTNVANLELGRSLSRRTEIAICMSMGASRSRIFFQLLLESLLLGWAGGLLGLLLAWFDLHVIVRLMPPEIANFVPNRNSIGINWRVFFYSLFMAALTGLLCGIGPTLAVMRRSPVEMLKAGAVTTTPERKSQRLRRAFVTSQISFSLALAVVAAMLAMSLVGVIRAANHLQPQEVLTFQIILPDERYSTNIKRAAFYEETMRRLRSLPGVDSVGLGTALPFGNPGMWWESFTLPGEPDQDHPRYTERYWISSDYLNTLRVPLLTGRMLSDSDVAGRGLVAVVNQSFVQRFTGQQNALGQRIHLGTDPASPWITIVGVASDVPMSWMDHSVQPAIYLSYGQFPQHWAIYAVRTRNSPASIASSVRSAISEVDPAVPIESLDTYDTYLHDAFIALRVASGTMIANAVTTLLLAALGIFGAMTTLVVERSGEIGVRMALGASRATILKWVLRQSTALTTMGIFTGVPLALGLSLLVVHFLYTSFTGELAILLLTPPLVFAFVQLAALVPARRAAAVDPIQALRRL
jgi:predicted permease